MPDVPNQSRQSPASAGDSATSTRIDALRRRATRLAVKLVWNVADAEELVQEAFRIAVSSGVGFDEERFEPWMLRTVGNLCLNLRRRRRAEPLGPWIDAKSTETPPDIALRRERLERIREEISRLPAQQRLAITLRSMEQMSYAEIAEIMELSEETVRGHVHLARRKLAELFEGS
jgi:RNA polymerase sigma-70 factor (ECF subfamily)